MDLNALSVFVTLYKSGSTQRAAVKLNRSQSFVSKTLAQLREDLQDPLFIRTAGGLKPTSYATQIAPKIQRAIEQLSIAIEPEDFDPTKLQYISIHIAEPLLVLIGKQLIQRLRQETNATIELRQWRKESNNNLIDGIVDIGIQALKDRPQQLYQKKIASGAAKMIGNQSGEFVKFLIDDYNEHLNLFRIYGNENLNASIMVDNHVVLNQLMDEHYTYHFQLPDKSSPMDIGLDIALICSASKRHEPKILWLSNLCESVINQAINN